MSGNGVGVGVGDCADLGRPYFVWPNANEVTRAEATVAVTIRVTIKRLIFRFRLTNAKRKYGQARRRLSIFRSNNQSAAKITTKSSQVV